MSVLDVATYILMEMGEIPTMKLHKLVYYSQAWSLVWDGKPLFTEQIEAWANGPVIRKLYDYHQGQYVIASIAIGNIDVFNQEQKITIDAIIKYYGDKSSQWLMDLTMMENPWRLTRKGMDDTERGSRTIRWDAMAEYYSSLPTESLD